MKHQEVLTWLGRVAPTVACLALAGLAPAAYCEEKGAAGEHRDAAATTVMSIQLKSNGDIDVLDGHGKPVEPCLLAGATKHKRASPKSEKSQAGTCKDVTKTTIEEILPMSVVHYTGSNCYVFTYPLNGRIVSRTVCH